jgi:hypothetical protein
MANKVLWIDGLKYKLEPPKNEPNEFQPGVEKHVQDIFGKDSIYLRRFAMESIEKSIKIPDGFVITLYNHKPQLYIIEYELYKKIKNGDAQTFSQLNIFKIALKNHKTKRELSKKFANEIRKDQVKSEIAVRNYGEISQLTNDIVEEDNPEIVVIVDSFDASVNEAFQSLEPIHYIEFQTFKNGEKEAYVFDRMEEFSEEYVKSTENTINIPMKKLDKIHSETITKEVQTTITGNNATISREKIESIQATIAGKVYTITREQIENAAENPKINTFGFNDWYVEHKGERYPIKGLMHIATGIPRDKFNSLRVIPLLEKLGFEVKKVER